MPAQVADRWPVRIPAIFGTHASVTRVVVGECPWDKVG